MKTGIYGDSSSIVDLTQPIEIKKETFKVSFFIESIYP